LVGKPEGKRPLGRIRCRWEDIRLDLREISVVTPCIVVVGYQLFRFPEDGGSMDF
jgi:hypothetical protein